MRNTLYFVVLINVLLNFNPSMSIKCYQCEELLGQGLHCESNVKSLLQPNCTEGFMCIKYVWATDNSTMLHRGCAPESKCEELTASLANLKYCGTCSTALCNSADGSYLHVFTGMFLSTLTLMFS